MKLDTAIKTLAFLVDQKADTISANEKEATELGIEALKRCKYISEHTARWADVPLAGETKE